MTHYRRDPRGKLSIGTIPFAVISVLFFSFPVHLASATQVADCISQFPGNEEALEGCLSQLYLPHSMDANELLEVHRTILNELKNLDYDTVHRGAKISAKLCIVHLASDWYSADVAAHLVARIKEEMGGDVASIIARATVSGAIEASEILGVQVTPAAPDPTSKSPALQRGTVAATTADQVSIYMDNEVVVSTPTDGNPTP